MPAASTTEDSTSTDSNGGPAPDWPEPGLPRSSGRWAGRDLDSNPVERRTNEIGRELFDRMGRGPRPWQRAWWEARFIGATLDDPLVRVQLFRFIDALPALHTDQAVRRHLAEYLAEAGDRVPWWLRLAIELAPPGSAREGWLAGAARSSAGVMARKFIAGATPAEAIQTVVGLRRRRLAFTADLLGEAVISELEADRLPANLPDAPARPGRPDPLRARDPADRPRRARPDSSRQSFAQAVELDGPLRADPRRDNRSSTSRRGCGRSCGSPARKAPRSTSIWSNTPIARSATSCSAGCSRNPSFATGPMWESWCRPITQTPRPSCGCCATGSSAAALRSRSAWSRARTGIMRSRPPGGWAGPSRFTCRNGRATPASSDVPAT